MEKASTDQVAAGSTVTLVYEGDDDADAERYLLGSIEERVEGSTVISVGSPLGAALLGHRAGDMVAYQAPNGLLKVVIKSIDG